MPSLFNRYLTLIRQIIPSKPEGIATGVDIGSSDCKFVQIKKSGTAFELINWGIEPVAGGDVEGSLGKLLERLETPYNTIYTAVFGKGTLIRYIEMPRMSLEDLRNSFGIEADKYFPFAQDQIYTDCFILDPQGKDRQMSVMAAAAKRELIDKRVELLKKLDIPVDFIGINAVALANGVHVLSPQGPEEKSKAVALFDMGDSVSNLTILVDGMPRFTRDIFIGGRDYTKRISNALGISFEDAEKLKKNPAEKSEEIINACESAIMNVIQELRLSFDYFTTEKTLEIGKLLLSGGGSMLTSLTDIFSKTLDVEIGVWDPARFLKISPQLSAEEVQQKSITLGVAVGLALYQYDRN